MCLQEVHGMNKLKTVKEVCELTGLNRKALHDYDKAGVVKPTDYATNGYEGTAKKQRIKVNYSGYKLYDDDAVSLLKQIGIYVKLKIRKRYEIIQLMKAGKEPDVLLDELLQLLQQREKEIKESIIVAEQLKVIGMMGELSQYYASLDFSRLAENSERWQASQSIKIFEEVLSKPTEEFEKEVGYILEKLLSISETQLESDETREDVKEFLSIVKRYFGFIGWLTAIIMAFVVEGGGEAANDIVEDYSKEAVMNSAKAICNYAKYDIDLLWDKCADIVVQNHSLVEKNFAEPAVKEMVYKLKEILLLHTGVSTQDEYVVFFEWMKEFGILENNKYMNNALHAMEYYHHKSV